VPATAGRPAPAEGSAACDTTSTSSSTPAVPVTAPARSIDRRPPRTGGSPGSVRTAASTAATIGTLTRNTPGSVRSTRSILSNAMPRRKQPLVGD
jgi:hypothetical protein